MPDKFLCKQTNKVHHIVLYCITALFFPFCHPYCETLCIFQIVFFFFSLLVAVVVSIATVLCPHTCLFIQCKQTGHVTSEETVGNLSEPAGVSVGSDDIEDFSSGLRVAADAHGVLVWVKHWSVIIQVLYLHVHIGLSAQASLS